MSTDNEARWYITEFKCDDNLENGIGSPCGDYSDLEDVDDRIRDLINERLREEVRLLFGPLDHNYCHNHVVSALNDSICEDFEHDDIKMFKMGYFGVRYPEEEARKGRPMPDVFIVARIRNYYWAVKQGRSPPAPDHLQTIIGPRPDIRRFKMIFGDLDINKVSSLNEYRADPTINDLSKGCHRLLRKCPQIKDYRVIIPDGDRPYIEVSFEASGITMKKAKAYIDKVIQKTEFAEPEDFLIKLV